MHFKRKIMDSIDLNIETYFEIVKEMYNHPEIGNEEIYSSKLLVECLTNQGFEVLYPHICPTGFFATYKSLKKGPRIGFLCEYDALPIIGHGCGHNMIGTMSCAAAISLKTIVDELGGEIHVFGTPAEENFGGKITFAEQGAFKNTDVCLMLHPSTQNGLGGRTNALMPIRFEFFGKTAHGCRPEEGKSALDAAVLTFSSINMLRQFVRPHTFIHGIFSNGGEAANIIPGYASLDYYFRGAKMDYVKELVERGVDIAKGAALATGTKMTYQVYETPYDDFKINYGLCEILREAYHEVGIDDIEEVDENPHGSSDAGSVSYLCPTLHGYIKIAEKCVLGHSKELAEATISNQGKEALLKGSKALALVALKLFSDSSLLDKLKKE